ncbi:hypothetical protein TeGR_g11934 [Tetraparma gracilis]|jgi:hypothetical protein|uniref:Uncharacterized protein n=1 Tax=Tetraparma gracilis TaxID=2962635 RepID=A0ABQ6NF10_9STRA|nr:hypothetical protein TeGR_g11934 [Tetraparma gracilis]
MIAAPPTLILLSILLCTIFLGAGSYSAPAHEKRAHAASPTTGALIHGSPITFLTADEVASIDLGGFDGTEEEWQSIFHNAEAHQHPWLATAISVGILMMIIAGVMCLADASGGEDEVRRMMEVVRDVGEVVVVGGAGENGGAAGLRLRGAAN